MAVIVQYVVVRDGDEKMTFATKKEADAYDKMLDIADNLYDFLEEKSLPLSEEAMETVSMVLAENADTVLKIMKGVKVTKKASPGKDTENKETGTSPSRKNQGNAKKSKISDEASVAEGSPDGGDGETKSVSAPDRRSKKRDRSKPSEAETSA